jgi:hypothetical protein
LLEDLPLESAGKVATGKKAVLGETERQKTRIRKSPMNELKLITTAVASLAELAIGAGLIAQQFRIGDAVKQASAPGHPSAKAREGATAAS